MFKNYITVALRSLQRNKGYAIINITGLAVGMAACLLIFMVIRYQLSFDTFHKNRENIYRVVSVYNSPAGKDYSPGVNFPVAKTLRADYPQVKKVAAIFGRSHSQVIIPGSNEIKKFKEE